MTEVQPSLWQRSLLLRAFVYAMISSVLLASLAAIGMWLRPSMRSITLTDQLQFVATLACVVFWISFVIGFGSLWVMKRIQGVLGEE
jgi:hypothetical protein